MKLWKICIFCGNEQLGEPIPASMWDVLSKLASVREAVYHLGWTVEAYPIIREVSQ